MPTESLSNFAKELKKLREEKKTTIQQISSKTKIDVKFLIAIEDANFDILPELYIRAFLREYAQVLDLNAAEIVSRYERAKKGTTIEEETKGKEKAEAEIGPAKKTINYEVKKVDRANAISIKSIKNLLAGIEKRIYYLTALTVIALAVIVYFLTDNNSQKIVVEKPYEEVLKEHTNVSNAIKSELAEIPMLAADSLSLNIKTKDTVWLKVTTDAATKEYLLPPNKSLTVKSLTNFRLVIGNAGGIDVELNNKPLQSLGKPGEVKTVLISKQGVQFLSNNFSPSNEQKN